MQRICDLNGSQVLGIYSFMPRRKKSLVRTKSNDPRVQLTRPKLRDLKHSQVAFERVAETHRSCAIMGIHEHVCHRVDHGSVTDRATAPADAQNVTPNNGDCCMVINLQKRYLVLFLSQAHKNRIAPVQILGQVVYQDEPLDPCATFCAFSMSCLDLIAS